MKRVVLVALLMALVLAIAVGAGSVYQWRRPYKNYPGNLMLVLEQGTSSYQIARLLEERGVIESRWPIWVRHMLNRGATLKAGEYSFDHPLSPADVYLKLVRGDVHLYSVTIPEGSDRFDMARIVQRDLGVDPQAFLRASEDGGAIHDLDPKADTLEGYLFPDTYFFPRGVTAEQIVTRMLSRCRRVLATRIPPESQPSPDALRQVMTLASLVEKETPVHDERPVVAGVFRKRLKIGMPLQCDPTVIYAAKLAGRFAGTIKQSDLNFDSPYNTYRHAGLPPGPIASPGEAAIRAALWPAETDFLYFVSDDRGGHFFSRTLAEHNRKVARYRREVGIRCEADHSTSRVGSGSASRKVQHSKSR
ncbi:MAG: endolytic transglycosylase MltG [Acidobacteria bacterium]|nr:endolytic transglycosylase MltG [Acidobacteriota bacterium]